MLVTVLDVVLGGWVLLWGRMVGEGFAVSLAVVFACEYEAVAVGVAVGWRAC